MDSKFDFKELMKQRHSARYFLSKPIPEEILKEIMSTSLLTPSWGNSQPWNLYIASGKTIEGIRKEWIAKNKEGVKGYSDINAGHRTDFSERCQEQAKYVCCNDLIKEHLKPTDFEVQGSDNNEYPLLPILQKTAMFYSLCFLFDYVTLVEDKLHYKLNGYKTLTGDINVGTLSEANVDKGSWKQYLEIFKWQYNGGNLTDKSAIARNIVSLNITEDNTLLLSKLSFSPGV